MKHPTLLSMLRSVSFITTIFIFIFIISSPTSHGAEEDSNYLNCKKTYNCGEQIKEIGYPFWGGYRPPFCGVQGFELTCQGNENTTIVMDKLVYRVLGINQSTHNMTIARTDMWEDICHLELPNTTLNFNLFDYSHPRVENISLSYGCPVSPYMRHGYPHQFNCPLIDDQSTTSFLLVANESFVLVEQCKTSIRVPVFRENFDALGRNEYLTLQKLLELVKKGFGVKYHATEYLKACDACNASGGVCGTNKTTHQPTCFCSNGPLQSLACPSPIPNPNQGYRNKRLMGNIAIAVGATILVTCCASLIFWVGKKTSLYKSIFFWRKSTTADDNVEAFLKINGSLVPKRYSYSSIKKLTNSFQDELGKGGYGGVYKGKLLDGRPVAVKLLNETKGSNGEEFINEVASISGTSHVNIVSLVGYCFEGRKRALIYEYMPNGSLEKFIYNNKPQQGNNGLEWKTMHKIAVGVARGLEYLHRGCTTRIFHFDIKPHNILLDEEFCPKISDFGLAKLCPKKESIVSMLHARGTVGYIAPEVFSRHFGRVSHKADVYSYGMLVLEMVRGRENIGESVKDSSELYFPHSFYKKLKCNGDIGLCGIENEEDEKVARKMILVGLCCIQANPLERPAINKVIEMLEGNLESLQVPPEPFLSLHLGSLIASSNIQISEENESSELELL